MQIIPAASGAGAPAAAEYVQAMGASGLPATGLSFESVLAASVQNARTGHSPGKGGGQMADGMPGDGQGMLSLHLLAALRRKAGPDEEEAEVPEADYLLAGMLATHMDTHIPQTDGSAETDDAVAHILQGDVFQTPVGPTGADVPAAPPSTQGEGADFSREMLARMPQPHDPQAQAADAASATATDGGSCPLENVNDLIDPSIRNRFNPLTNRVGQSAAQLTAPEAEAAPETARVQPQTETQPQAGGQHAETDTQEAPEADPTGMSIPLDLGVLRARGEPIQAPPVSSPVTATSETLLDTLVESLSLERQGDSHQMEIQLRPEHLGKVTIQLTLDGTGVQAKIRTEDPGVRGLINSQVNQLIESLEQKGVRLTAVDVTYQAPQSQDFTGQGGGRQQMSQENRNRGLGAQAIARGGEAHEAEVPYAALTVDTYVSQTAGGADLLL